MTRVYAHNDGWIYLDDKGNCGQCCHSFSKDEDPWLIANIAQFEIGGTVRVVTPDCIVVYQDEGNWSISRE
jgi:hypothetical protein